jgi:hypothetical protein
VVSINRLWWEHLAPKVIHGRLREVEKLLRNWCRSEYGAHWLSVAQHEQGIMRVKQGQIVPAVHLIGLGERPMFIAPMARVRDGDRMVTTGQDAFRSGKPLEEGEFSLTPEIVVEVVHDAEMLNLASRNAKMLARGAPMDLPSHVTGVKEPSILLSLPAKFLIAPKAWPKKAYVLYQHIFGEGPSYPHDGYFYVGVTTRTWQARWNEHRRAIEAGSPLLFHRKFREEFAAGRVTYIHHKVMGITEDVQALYATEEALVEGHWSDARRLNMIPGGKSGLRYMRENGMLPERVIPLPDERDRILAEWLRDRPRKGLPAPWVSEKWKDTAWAVAQICGRDGRLSIEQVRAIRELAQVHSVEEIARRIGADNREQVDRVLKGKTYTRVV